MTPPAFVIHLDFWLDLGQMFMALGSTLPSMAFLFLRLCVCRELSPCYLLCLRFWVEELDFQDVASFRLGGVFPLVVFGLRRGAGSDFSFHRVRDGLVMTLMTMPRCT